MLTAIGREAVATHNKYAEYFSAQQPFIAVISALAEGADRLGAHAAIALQQTAPHNIGVGFQLDVPFPFSVDAYKKDFKTEDSKSEFDALLRDARRFWSCLANAADRAIPNRRTLRENCSYEDAGLSLLNQSDLILAVWDGEAGAGRGGTRDLLDIAARSGTPIIHIDAKCERPLGSSGSISINSLLLRARR